jgi:hypothetical protein
LEVSEESYALALDSMLDQDLQENGERTNETL